MWPVPQNVILLTAIRAQFRSAGQEGKVTPAAFDSSLAWKINTVEITTNGIDLEAENLVGPASTWTCLITDQPAGDVSDWLSRSVKRLLTRR